MTAVPPTPTASTPAGNERASRSTTAAQVLVSTDAARLALADQNKDQARVHVDAALFAANTLMTVPLVPVYTELSQVSLIEPIKRAKDQAGQEGRGSAAKEPGQATPKISGIEGSRTQPSPPMKVGSVAAEYTRLLLDTSVARRQLTEAKAALDRGDLAQADRALRIIQQGVILETATARLPLIRARQNLSMAMMAAQAGRWQDAKAQLDAAADGLDQYVRTAPPARIGDARVLKKEIDGLADTITTDNSNAVIRIRAWWDRLADWSDQQA